MSFRLPCRKTSGLEISLPVRPFRTAQPQRLAIPPSSLSLLPDFLSLPKWFGWSIRNLKFKTLSADGDYVETGTALAEMSGSARSILAVERVTLNLLQRMCGIATMTRHYVDRVRGTKARVIDTRKTAPGLRLLDKYAVACGGGTNHRMGLFDAVLIKNNHLAFHKSLSETLAEARCHLDPSMKLEVEVASLDQLDEAIHAKADVILLDNFTPDQTRHAVIQCGGRVPLESSGGITLENIRDYAVAGVDRISVGALTHSVLAADIHLRVIPN